MLAFMEMYVEGVSTRKVKDITEELCGTSFSKSFRDTRRTCNGSASLPVSAVATTTNTSTVADSTDHLLETPTNFPTVENRIAAVQQILEFLRHLG